jgi:hypothetical protein
MTTRSAEQTPRARKRASAGTPVSKSEEWGHLSSRHSCIGPISRSALAPITPPGGGCLPELFAGQRMHGRVERDYKEAGAVRTEGVGYARPPYRTEPLEIILLYKKRKNLTDTYSYS